MGRRVKAQGADFDGFPGQMRRPPPQHGTDAGHQLFRRKRLGDVVVGARLQPLNLVFFVDTRRQHDDRQFARAFVGAKLAGQPDPGLAGQHPVEHQQIGQLVADDGFAFFGAGCADNLESGMAQIDRNELKDGRLVFNHQNRRGHAAPPAFSLPR